MSMPLSATEIVYQSVQVASIDTNISPPSMEDLGQITSPIWASNLLWNLDLTLSFDEFILEAMNNSKKPWEDFHHRSYFLSDLDKIEYGDINISMVIYANWCENPLATQSIYAKGNMANISKTMPINT
jgi:hypothetical protein